VKSPFKFTQCTEMELKTKARKILNVDNLTQKFSRLGSLKLVSNCVCVEGGGP